MYSRKRGILSMRSGTVVGQGSPYGRQCGLLRILLWSQSHLEEAEKRRDHVLRFDDKEIEGWHGTRRGFSMWEEGIGST